MCFVGTSLMMDGSYFNARMHWKLVGELKKAENHVKVVLPTVLPTVLGSAV